MLEVAVVALDINRIQNAAVRAHQNVALAGIQIIDEALAGIQIIDAALAGIQIIDAALAGIQNIGAAMESLVINVGARNRIIDVVMVAPAGN